jgi:hypothetical protein
MLRPVTNTPPRSEAVVALAHAARGLGLHVDELEELITAAHDRADALADPGQRARLGRGRRALERELSRLLEE